jgi:hypothetical protein
MSPRTPLIPPGVNETPETSSKNSDHIKYRSESEANYDFPVDSSKSSYNQSTGMDDEERRNLKILEEMRSDPESQIKDLLFKKVVTQQNSYKANVFCSYDIQP